MTAIWDAPYGILGLILRQADGAWAVVGPRQTTAFAENNLRVGLDHGPIEAQNHYNRVILVHNWSLGHPIAIVVGIPATITAAAAATASTITATGFNSYASVGSEHDGGDEYKDAYCNGYAITKADSGGGSRRVGRRHIYL
ncbi:hypothetical protein QQP08_005578 [Theobroma cacao]|nr:hypothetical protein QQP08_005578 [Theobroma cacao]